MTDNQIYGRGWILAALMLTMMLAAMDSTIISTAIPHIVSSLGGFNKFSWVFSIYLLAQTVTIPIYGKITDLYGRKKNIIIWNICFSTGFSFIWFCLEYRIFNIFSRYSGHWSGFDDGNG